MTVIGSQFGRESKHECKGMTAVFTAQRMSSQKKNSQKTSTSSTAAAPTNAPAAKKQQTKKPAAQSTSNNTAVATSQPAVAPAPAQQPASAAAKKETKTPAEQMKERISTTRERLVKLHKEHATAARTKWDSWSVAVRQEFMRRAQNAVVASVQASVPRKQGQQWAVTIKFVLDDVFEAGRKCGDHKFDDKDGLASLIKLMLDGQENAKDPAAFEKKVDDMLAEMKDGQVPGFKMEDKKVHTNTLRDMRSIYGIEWAAYIVSKLAAN